MTSAELWGLPEGEGISVPSIQAICAVPQRRATSACKLGQLLGGAGRMGIADIGAIAKGLGFGEADDVRLLRYGLVQEAEDGRGVLVEVGGLAALGQGDAEHGLFLSLQSGSWAIITPSAPATSRILIYLDQARALFIY